MENAEVYIISKEEKKTRRNFGEVIIYILPGVDCMCNAFIL